ncbi:MAG: SCO family protein [Bacillota bacterium]
MQQPSIPKWIWAGLGAGVALILAAAAALWTLGGAAGRSETLPVLAAMPDFRLTDQEGKAVAAADVKGKVTLVGFIYTSCTDICPVVTAQMRNLQDELRAAGLLGEVRLLSISVDPEVDTPQRLADYARQFQADTATWRFLTGEPGHVHKVVVEGFLVGAQKIPAAGHGSHGSQGTTTDYRVEHSGRIALVDRSGQIRAYYEGTGLNIDEVVNQARILTQGR